MIFLLSLIFLLLSQFPLSSSVPILEAFDTLNLEDPPYPCFFGFSMASSGNLLAVGDPISSDRTTAYGGVYLYDCSSLPNPCILLDRMVNPPISGETFGDLVSISGTRVLLTSQAPSECEKAHLFDCATLPCNRILQLNEDCSNATADIRTIAISGELVAIGSSPSSQIFHCPLSSSNCTRITELSTGEVLAMDGRKIITAQLTEVLGSNGTYQAHIHECSPSSCEPWAIIPSPTHPPQGSLFGFAVAIQGDLVAFSSTINSYGYSGGVVYVFRCSGRNSCLHLATIESPDEQASIFGITLTIQDSMLVISSGFDNSLFLYDCSPELSTCNYLAKLVGSDPEDLNYISATIGWYVFGAAGARYGAKGYLQIFDPAPFICKCSPQGSNGEHCDSNRQCSCKPGWIGPQCSIPPVSSL